MLGELNRVCIKSGIGACSGLLVSGRRMGAPMGMGGSPLDNEKRQKARRGELKIVFHGRLRLRDILILL